MYHLWASTQDHRGYLDTLEFQHVGPDSISQVYQSIAIAIVQKPPASRVSVSPLIKIKEIQVQHISTGSRRGEKQEVSADGK